jgi:cytochrome bd-type quinol oxidase subunit 2
MIPVVPNPAKENTASQSTRTTVASVAAIGSVLAASSCCLPVLPFVFAAGVAGSATFLTALRPYLLGLSIVLVAFGFYQTWRAKQCRSRTSVLSSILLWSSAFFVIVSIFFPELLANAAANLMTR